MISANITEHVLCLISDLEMYKLRFRFSGFSTSNFRTLEHRVTAYDSFTVEARVSSDQLALLTRLETEINSSNANNEDSQMVAKRLANRLTHDLSRAVDVRISDWEMEYSTLKSTLHSLGKGSFGEVRKSTWLGVEVAEKRLIIGSDHPSFMQEVEILARLTHPNIVTLIGYARDRRNISAPL